MDQYSQLFPFGTTTTKEGQLVVGGCLVDDLVSQYGSPLLIYDQDHLIAEAKTALAEFGANNVSYATKAFLCKELAKIFKEIGLSFDVSSTAEVETLLSVGVAGSDIVLHGNNKSQDELKIGLDQGALIVIDSLDELDRLINLTQKTNKIFKVMLRVAPAISLKTHQSLSTGKIKTKFGLPLKDGSLKRALAILGANNQFNLTGVHVHLGSQILDLNDYAFGLSQTLAALSDFKFDHLSVGGGLGVSSNLKQETPSIKEWARVIRKVCAKTGFAGRISVEPGRCLVARAGLAVYTVGTLKKIPAVCNYVAVDGGLSDNPRPALYQADYEAFLIKDILAKREMLVQVVGKHCESGDILVRRGKLPKSLALGDRLVIPVSGAYHYSMSSNYQRLPKPAVVFVTGGRAKLVIRRQTIEDLLAQDV